MRSLQAFSIVHSENTYARGQKKRPRGPRTAPTAVESTGFSLLDAIPQRPLVDLKTQAIVYYLNYHLQTLHDAPHIVKCVTDHFMPIWRSGKECELLDLAVSCMSLAIFSRTQHYLPAAVQASENYSQLLQLAQKTLPSMNENNIDACLLTIFFMSRYEDAVYQPYYPNVRLPFTSTCTSFPHHDGALASLKTWKHNHNRPATDIIRRTRRSMVKSALMRSIGLPEWIQDGSAFGEKGLDLEYDRIDVRIVNLRHRLFTLLDEGTSGPQRTNLEFIELIQALNEEAQDIDNACIAWSTHFPSSWSYEKHELSESPACPTDDFYSSTVYTYSSLACAAVWNAYYITRMLVHSTKIQILNLIAISSSPSVAALSDSGIYDCNDSTYHSTPPIDTGPNFSGRDRNKPTTLDSSHPDSSYDEFLPLHADATHTLTPHYALRSRSSMSHQRTTSLIIITRYSDALSSSLPYCLHKIKLIKPPSRASRNSSVPTTTPTPNSSFVAINRSFEELRPYVANLAVWPLSIASCIIHLDEDRKVWFRRQLANLGRVNGYGVIESIGLTVDGWFKF